MHQSSSSSSLHSDELESRRLEIEEEIRLWKQGNEFCQLSEDCREELEKRMRKEKHSAFYLQLVELTQ